MADIFAYITARNQPKTNNIMLPVVEGLNMKLLKRGDPVRVDFGISRLGTFMAVCAGILQPEVIGATQKSFPLFRCPKCKQVGTIDDDQFHGRVSTQCFLNGCDYHETRDWSQT